MDSIHKCNWFGLSEQWVGEIEAAIAMLYL